MVDSMIDMMLNYRQSGHPGRLPVQGPPARVHAARRRDALGHPPPGEGVRRSSFVLVAGHTVPLIYATLTVLGHALRLKYEKTGDREVPHPGRRTQKIHRSGRTSSMLRRNGGLAGHAEMEGKTLFFKFNTGPSGPRFSPPAAGEAMALKRAGALPSEGVRVRGRGGSHDRERPTRPGTPRGGSGSATSCTSSTGTTRASIRDRCSSVVLRLAPTTGSEPPGWRTYGARRPREATGSPSTRVLLEGVHGPRIRGSDAPPASGVRTLKGRGYAVTGYKSHGAGRAAELARATGSIRARVHGEVRHRVRRSGPAGPRGRRGAASAQVAENIQRALSLYEKDPALLDYVADRLVEIGDSVPEKIETVSEVRPRARSPFEDSGVLGLRIRYPEDHVGEAGGQEAEPRRPLPAGASYVNSLGRKKYGRPLFLAMSADLADSTNISGFAKDFERPRRAGAGTSGTTTPRARSFRSRSRSSRTPGCRVGHRLRERLIPLRTRTSTASTGRAFHVRVVQLPQVRPDETLQPGGAGLRDPGRQGALGRAGHSGPETAEDSRTHFGIFAPGGHAALPRRAASATCTRGSTTRCRWCWARRSRLGLPDRRAAPHAAARRDSRTGSRSESPRTWRRRRVRTSIRDYDPSKPPEGRHRPRAGDDERPANLFRVLPEIDEGGTERPDRRGRQSRSSSARQPAGIPRPPSSRRRPSWTAWRCPTGPGDCSSTG